MCRRRGCDPLARERRRDPVVVQFSNKMKSGSQPGGRPLAAVELAPEGALAAAIPAPGQSAEFAFAGLPAGALVPGIAESNLRNARALTEALRTALEEVSPRSRHVTLVVPD